MKIAPKITIPEMKGCKRWIITCRILRIRRIHYEIWIWLL